jgi:chorismate synthase
MVGGLKLGEQPINSQMARRQAGFGRGARMKMERDTVQILSGTRRGSTIGSPIALMIKNRDFSIDRLPQVRCPRPGHADLAGAIKYNSADIRDVLERASARETAARVAVGAICKVLLGEFDVQISSRVVMIGGVSAKNPRLMNARIASCAKKGDTLGGIFEVVARGVCAGLGSFAQSDRRLDGRLAGTLMSIQAIKGVEIGLGFESAKKCGSQVHDAIYYAKTKGFYRSTNNAGGLEGGVTNGEPVVIRCAMKPISTLANPLASVDINSKRPSRAAVERSDVCAVQSAGVVAEAAMAFELAAAMLEKFGGDSLGETKRNFDGYLKQVKSF